MSARFGYKNRIRNAKFLNRIHDFGYFAIFRYLYPKTGSVRLSEGFIRVVFRIQKWWLQDCYIRIVSETFFGFSAKKEERGIQEGESMTHNYQKIKLAKWLITTSRDRWTRMSAACPPRVRVRDFSKNSCPCPRPCPRCQKLECPCPRPCPRSQKVSCPCPCPRSQKFLCPCPRIHF